MKIVLIEFKLVRRFDHFLSCQPQPGPNADRCEHNGDKADVEFKRDVSNKVVILDQFKQTEQHRHRNAVNDYRPSHLVQKTKSRQTFWSNSFESMAETTGFEPVVPFWSTTV